MFSTDFERMMRSLKKRVSSPFKTSDMLSRYELVDKALKGFLKDTKIIGKKKPENPISKGILSLGLSDVIDEDTYYAVKSQILNYVSGLGLDDETGKNLLYFLSYNLLIPLLPPKTISVDLSETCNLRCRICNQWKDTNPNRKLDYGDLVKLFDDVSDNFPDTLVEFSGQEPMLKRELLFKAMEYGTKKDVLMSMNTNGTLLTKKDAERLYNFKLNHVTISLDGFKETHDYIRSKNGAFDASIRAVKELLRSKKKTGKKKPVISVTFVITKRNLSEIIEFMKFLKELGVDTINFNPFALDNSYFFNKDATYENNEFWIGKDDMPLLKNTVDMIIKMKSGGSLPLITNTEKQLLMIPEYFRRKDRYHKRTCLAGFNYFHITNFGEITVCGKGPRLNIRNHTLQEIWDSENMLRTRLSVRRCTTPCLSNCFELV